MARNANPAGAGGAGEDAGGDFSENKPTTSDTARQAPWACWLKLIDQAEQRSHNAPIEQRPKHRRLYKYLAARLARAMIREARQ